MTTLVLILFLSPIFGGEVRAEVSFASPAACERFVQTLEKYTVRHTIVSPCAPA